MSEKSRLKYCENCGYNFLQVKNYCPECGYKIELESEISGYDLRGFLTANERMFNYDFEGFVDTYYKLFPKVISNRMTEYIKSLEDTSFVLKVKYLKGDFSEIPFPKIYDSPQFRFSIPNWLETALEQIPVNFRDSIRKILRDEKDNISISMKRWFIEIVDMDHLGNTIKFLYIRFRLNYGDPFFGWEQDYSIDRIIRSKVEDIYSLPKVLRLKGVSFENRQENIRKLKHRWEKLILMIDSSSGGMLVKSYDGEIGFIPQEESLKIRFLYDYIGLTVLLEDVVGTSSYENLGVKVLIYPSVYGLDYNKISYISDYHKYIDFFRNDEVIPLSWKRDIE